MSYQVQSSLWVFVLSDAFQEGVRLGDVGCDYMCTEVPAPNGRSKQLKTPCGHMLPSCETPTRILPHHTCWGDDLAFIEVGIEPAVCEEFEQASNKEFDSSRDPSDSTIVEEKSYPIQLPREFLFCFCFGPHDGIVHCSGKQERAERIALLNPTGAGQSFFAEEEVAGSPVAKVKPRGKIVAEASGFGQESRPVYRIECICQIYCDQHSCRISSVPMQPLSRHMDNSLAASAGTNTHLHRLEVRSEPFNG